MALLQNQADTSHISEECIQREMGASFLARWKDVRLCYDINIQCLPNTNIVLAKFVTQREIIFFLVFFIPEFFSCTMEGCQIVLQYKHNNINILRQIAKLVTQREVGEKI